jgi:hypothetical protein
VTPGDLGGYIESENNLDQFSGDAWVYGDAQVFGDAWVSGDARVSGNAQVYGNAKVSGNARVFGNARVSSDATKTPIQVGGLRWWVTITDTHMRIGCQEHSLVDWAGFDDKQIAGMDDKHALRFWRAHKDRLLGLARADGRLNSQEGGAV